MIEIFNPETMVVAPIAWKLGSGWHYPLDYTWVLQQLREFTIPMDEILDVGSSWSKLADHLRENKYTVYTMDRVHGGSPDIVADFLDYKFSQPYTVILWVSSIEHQESVDLIRACVEKSMDLLAPGGVFIATFPISTSTAWFDPAGHWNLSESDSMRVFDERTIRGKYYPIWNVYRSNKFGLRDAYVSRFDRWDHGTPEYIAAGVVKVKDR